MFWIISIVVGLAIIIFVFLWLKLRFDIIEDKINNLSDKFDEKKKE